MGFFDIFKKKQDTPSVEQAARSQEELNAGLEKTKTGLFSKLARAVAGRSTVDAEVLDDLEEVLISSDVGVETTVKIIRRRIKNLEDGLESLSRRRKLARERREKDEVETVAIVGYTNAGKSTLMNTLTQAGVLAEDKLFATLDPTSRALTLPDGRRVMLIDTVGFIRRLPHGLVEAFKSTLEEAASATLILNVCDASSPDCAEHLEVTNRLLEELGCKGKPIIAVFNKCDAAPDLSWLSAGLHSVKISALTGEGLDGLLNEMVRALPPTRKKVTLLLPYSMGSDAALLRKKGALDREEYRPDGLKMTVTADAKLLERYKDYII